MLLIKPETERERERERLQLLKENLRDIPEELLALFLSLEKMTDLKVTRRRDWEGEGGRFLCVTRRYGRKNIPMVGGILLRVS